MALALLIIGGFLYNQSAYDAKQKEILEKKLSNCEIQARQR